MRFKAIHPSSIVPETIRDKGLYAQARRSCGRWNLALTYGYCRKITSILILICFGIGTCGLSFYESILFLSTHHFEWRLSKEGTVMADITIVTTMHALTRHNASCFDFAFLMVVRTIIIKEPALYQHTRCIRGGKNDRSPSICDHKQ